ncbi:MAG: hypothetical protein PHW69_07090 [Elusimicrobiaceae bacterium]|nr:hypothetical protein [Elusimicrobiaceae bacterium]
MAKIKKIFTGMLVVGLCCIAAARGAEISAPEAPRPDVQVPAQLHIEGLPPLNGWMFRHDGKKADWLGIAFEGKTLNEPINVIIADSHASSAGNAEARLLAACEAADYKDRYGHSSDYMGFINGVLVPQFPSRRRHSFANKVFEETNNHGRIFGPVQYRGQYWFLAAFSREKVHFAPRPEHKFVSFNQARDDFGWRMNRTGRYLVKDFVRLDNAILGERDLSSGDHDGVAILLQAVK